MLKPSVLFVSSEVYPFAKSGGLADIAHSLPRALSKDCNIEVIMPLYSFVNRKTYNIVPANESFNISMNGIVYPVELYKCLFEGMSYRFIYSSLLCDRDFLYGPPDSGYEDNALRFALFSRVIIRVLKENSYDVVHLNDWQCGLVPLLIKEDKSINTKTLFTIHNLSYQGVFDYEVLQTLGIDSKYFTMECLEFYGRVNFIKAAIADADMVTTVSPSYAKEILTPEFGCGLEGFLSHHQEKLVGIINGIDTEHFSPSKDKRLEKPYSDLKAKATNKSAYIKATKLKGVRKPLFVFIGRFAWQKGMDLLIEALPIIASYECNIAILGDGEEKYHMALREIAKENSNVHLSFAYDESLSHRMYASADFLLMPSLFEPCGLSQIIAMAYGEVPIVHRVGGLSDTVKDYNDFDAKKAKGFGITFDKPSVDAFLKAIDEAMKLYENKSIYNKIAKHNMACDFSWQESAMSYLNLYEKISKKENL
ncbi:glycosyltransferase [Sulfurimonas aquatica]|uniref:Glycogen synthase n=1 Tax=Sulfurimonas aquatica TaxID=2672570 RepID=A0A975B0H2_9BACT|nr:glycogen synthase [Sulfurimonas aquatica]QSZ41939.1 glycosyltransferase [Sulfurimonas aquatica]